MITRPSGRFELADRTGVCHRSGSKARGGAHGQRLAKNDAVYASELVVEKSLDTADEIAAEIRRRKPQQIAALGANIGCRDESVAEKVVLDADRVLVRERRVQFSGRKRGSEKAPCRENIEDLVKDRLYLLCRQGRIDSVKCARLDQKNASARPGISARDRYSIEYVVKIAHKSAGRIKDREPRIEHRKDAAGNSAAASLRFHGIVGKHAAAKVHVRVGREDISRLADHRDQYLVEVNAETAADDGLRRRSPGKTEPRSEVIVVTLEYACSSVDESA